MAFRLWDFGIRNSDLSPCLGSFADAGEDCKQLSSFLQEPAAFARIAYIGLLEPCEPILLWRLCGVFLARLACLWRLQDVESSFASPTYLFDDSLLHQFGKVPTGCAHGYLAKLLVFGVGNTPLFPDMQHRPDLPLV